MNNRIYAVLNGNVVVNVTVGFVDRGVDVTDVSPRPSVGWLYTAGEFTPPPAFSRSSLDVRREAAQRINEAAGRARAKYLTDVTGQAETYMLKAEELRAYDAAISHVPSDYPILYAEALATGATLADTAYLVRGTRAQWIQLAAAIEGVRRGALVRVAAASTEAEVWAAIPTTWP